MMLRRQDIERVVRTALDEDAPYGDVTSTAFVPAEAHAQADLVAREDAVLAGTEVFEAAMAGLVENSGTHDSVRVEWSFGDGDRFAAGDVLATVSGPARAVLQSERVALNLLQRMCGVATMTALYVAAVDGRARVVDTRKTTPGMRALERHAVRCGGGHNHRSGLSDAVMAKDNHLAVIAEHADDLTEALRSAAARLPHTMSVEIEVDRLDQIEPVLASGVVDTIMLDNFSLDDLREGVRQVDGRAVVEASGGITLETIGDIAATGVDVISVGALTHSVRSIDLGLDVRVEARDR